MANLPGLRKNEAGIYEIDIAKKKKYGRRIRQSLGTRDEEEAIALYNKIIEEALNAKLYGIRPTRTFEQAAAYYLIYKQNKDSLEDDARHLKLLVKYIGDEELHKIHQGTFEEFIRERQEAGKKNKSINNALGVARHLLNLAATKWRDENNLTWLLQAPVIELLDTNDSRNPFVLSWKKQDELFAELAPHLREMATYKVNTGCRMREVCYLQWDWEYYIPELNTTIFIIPKEYTKNGDIRYVVLNSVARDVIDRQRGKHREYVFTYRGSPIDDMNSSSWERARKTVGLKNLRVHDLKHTFGHRLQAAGVHEYLMQDLLGHTKPSSSKNVTRHYCSSHFLQMIEAAERVLETRKTLPHLTLVKANSPDFHQIKKVATM